VSLACQAPHVDAAQDPVLQERAGDPLHLAAVAGEQRSGLLGQPARMFPGAPLGQPE
jgi:hypothetical protein